MWKIRRSAVGSGRGGGADIPYPEQSLGSDEKTRGVAEEGFQDPPLCHVYGLLRFRTILRLERVHSSVRVHGAWTGCPVLQLDGPLHRTRLEMARKQERV